MSLRLIYGRAGSGKSHFCLQDIKSRIEKGAENALVLVVPEQFSLQSERNLIKALGAGGILKTEVLSFRRMAYRVFNEVGGLERSHITPAGKSMVIYKIMDEMKDKLSFFAKAARQKGFVNTLSQTIAEFKRYNVSAELLNKANESLNEDELIKEKLREISLIYEKYNETISKKYMDIDDDLTELYLRLDESSMFDGAEIWIDEFSGFTPQEYKVIEKLLLKAKRVNVSLCTDCIEERNVDASSEVFSPLVNTAAKLLRIAERNGVAVDKHVVLDKEPFYRFKDSRELAHLERQYFSYPYVPYKEKTKNISIFTASNIYSEVEETARDILDLCRNRGARFSEIAVVTGNLEGYQPIIETIFSEYGIPYFIDLKRNIVGHPLIQLVLSIFEIYIKGWSYESVFTYLKTGLLNINRSDIDLIENYVLAWGIRGGKWTAEGDWNYRKRNGYEDEETSQREADRLNAVNAVRNRIRTPLMKLFNEIKGGRDAKTMCTALYEFLCETGVPERIEAKIDEFKNSGELDRANEYGQIWNIVMGVLDQIVEVMGDEKLSIQKFQRLLEIGFEECQTGLIPPALDQVLVGSIDRSKSHEISTLYILGVNDGIFPKAARDEGILSDNERDILRQNGVELAQDTRTKAFEEQYLVYTALSTAGKSLKLSCPIADNEGRTLRPSVIISRLKKIFPLITEYSNIISADSDEYELHMVSSPVPTFNEVVTRIRRQTEGFAINPIWHDVYRWYIQSSIWKDKCMTALRGLSYSNLAGNISPEKARKLYGSPMYSSVSRLESYASCAFSYYLQYGLKVRERDIFRLSAPDVGTFIHTVIDRFSHELTENGMSWRTMDKQWCTQQVGILVDEILGNMEGSIFDSSPRYRYLIERLKRVITKAVWVIAEQIRRSSFEPIGYEISFGDNKEIPPICLKLPNGEEIRLVGRIDRIDAMKSDEGTYLRIIDYKSGSKAFKISDVYYGLQMQLITYLDAIWENGIEGVEKPILPGGILYLKIDDPIIRVNGNISEEEIENEIMKQLRMKGLLLADVKLIKGMDSQIDGDSLIIPARINKDGSLGRSSAATMKQFEALTRHVKEILKKLGQDMLSGKVDISPYKNKNNTSCTYCRYSSVCQFDPSLKENKYRYLRDLKDDEAWQQIEQSMGSVADGGNGNGRN